MPLDVRFDSRDMELHLKGLVRFLGNMSDPNVNRKPLDEWGAYMRTRTDLLFETGSRDGVNWRKLSDSTKAGRRLRGIRHSKILQVSGDLTLSSGVQVVLTGGARPENVFWQVAGFVDFGTTAHAEGIVLTQTAITLRTGASIDGRLLAQTAVDLDASTVVEP